MFDSNEQEEVLLQFLHDVENGGVFAENRVGEADFYAAYTEFAFHNLLSLPEFRAAVAYHVPRVLDATTGKEVYLIDEIWGI